MEIVRAEMAKTTFKLTGKEKVVSWTVLIVLLLAQISNQWQRFMISAAFNYKMPDGEDPDPYLGIKDISFLLYDVGGNPRLHH